MWSEHNKLKLNDDKTEAVRFSIASSTSTVPSFPTSISLNNTDIEFSQTVRNLGFLLDNDLTLKRHIMKTCKAAYIEIRRISSIRQYLTVDAAKKLVTSSILSRLDYCNSLLANHPLTLIKPLQQVQNAAARIIFRSRKTIHCKPILKELHWLPVEQRIQYKICCLCFQIVTGNAPLYLSELLKTYTPSRTLRSSADNRIFCKPPTFKRKQHGGRTLCALANQFWNPLPFSLRHCSSLSTFKSKLKTHLFRQAFR